MGKSGVSLQAMHSAIKADKADYADVRASQGVVASGAEKHPPDPEAHPEN